MQYKVQLLLLGLTAFGNLQAQEKNGKCDLDIMWALDTSCSIAVDDGQKVRDFIVDVIEAFKIGPEDTQVGVVNFNKGTQHQFYLRESTDDETARQLAEDIDLSNLIYKNNSGCKTHTFQALDEIRNIYFTPENGDRKDVPNVVIVVTDGVTVQPKFQEDTIRNAQLLHQDGAEVVVIALPNQSGVNGTFEFFSVASDVRNVFTIETFEDLTLFINDITTAVCIVTQTTTPTRRTTPTTTTIPKTTAPVTVPSTGLCPRGFFTPFDKGTCQIEMNACPKNNPLCCGDCMLFADPLKGGYPNKPMYVTARPGNTRCLCEACMTKSICVPKPLRAEWAQARRQAGLPVE